MADATTPLGGSFSVIISMVMGNMMYLQAVMKNQAKILSKLTDRPESEIIEETNKLVEQSRKEVDSKLQEIMDRYSIKK